MLINAARASQSYRFGLLGRSPRGLGVEPHSLDDCGSLAHGAAHVPGVLLRSPAQTGLLGLHLRYDLADIFPPPSCLTHGTHSRPLPLRRPGNGSERCARSAEFRSVLALAILPAWHERRPEGKTDVPVLDVRNAELPTLACDEAGPPTLVVCIVGFARDWKPRN